MDFVLSHTISKLNNFLSRFCIMVSIIPNNNISNLGFHCAKSVQIRRSVFRPNTGKCGPQKTPYLDNFHAVFCVFTGIISLYKIDQTPGGKLNGLFSMWKEWWPVLFYILVCLL